MPDHPTPMWVTKCILRENCVQLHSYMKLVKNDIDEYGLQTSNHNMPTTRPYLFKVKYIQFFRLLQSLYYFCCEGKGSTCRLFNFFDVSNPLLEVVNTNDRYRELLK